MSEEQNTPFITDKQILFIWMNKGIDLDKAIPIFIKEICAYFNTHKNNTILKCYQIHLKNLMKNICFLIHLGWNLFLMILL